MIYLTGKISESFLDFEAKKEPEVTPDPPSVTYNIYIYISLIESRHKIVQCNPTKIVTAGEIVVAINKNKGFIDKVEDWNILTENLNKCYHLDQTIVALIECDNLLGENVIEVILNMSTSDVSDFTTKTSNPLSDKDSPIIF